MAGKRCPIANDDVFEALLDIVSVKHYMGFETGD